VVSRRFQEFVIKNDLAACEQIVKLLRRARLETEVASPARSRFLLGWRDPGGPEKRSKS
jgi:hypothetical protein